MPSRRRRRGSRAADGAWCTTIPSSKHIHQPCAARSSASSSSSPPSHSRGENPPTSRNAVTRNALSAASTPSRAGPGSQSGPGTGECRSSGTIGSSVRSGSTRQRPVTEANGGWASSTAAARDSAPGCQHVSSSQNATYGVCTWRTARLRASAPRLRSHRSSATPGNRSATASAVPSVEALSATITGAASGSVVIAASVRSASARRLCVIITTVTAVTRAPGSGAPPRAAAAAAHGVPTAVCAAHPPRPWGRTPAARAPAHSRPRGGASR